MNVERQGIYSIESDGSSVWVNGPLCLVARFGLVGYEFNNLSIMFGYLAPGKGAETNAEDWVKFVGTVRSMFGVMLGDMHRPTRFNRAA